MNIERLEVMVEEPSMEAALRAILPKIMGDIQFEIFTYRCKDDLLQRLPERLRAYSKFLPSNWRILIVVDRDDEDCRQLKAKLEDISAKAKLRTRMRSGSKWQVVNRIVIEELEAWYFGDWKAVKVAYPKVSETIPSQAKYRDPDAIHGAWEAFERVLQNAAYFKGGLRKIEAARMIAPYMDPHRNASKSFQALRCVLHELAQ